MQPLACTHLEKNKYAFLNGVCGTSPGLSGKQGYAMLDAQGGKATMSYTLCLPANLTIREDIVIVGKRAWARHVWKEHRRCLRC